MDEFQKEMFDVFAFETNTFLEQLETILMQAESKNGDILEAVPEIFRIMHTIKSSSAMMGFTNLSKLAHSMEDLFDYIRENKPAHVDKKKLTDMVLFGVDYIKRNMANPEEEEDATVAAREIAAYTRTLSGAKSATPGAAASDESVRPATGECQVRAIFKPDCVMIGLRAFEIILRIRQIQEDVVAFPSEDDPEAEAMLQAQGLLMTFPSPERLEDILKQITASPFIREAVVVSGEAAAPVFPMPDAANQRAAASSSYMGIEVRKLDKLINLAGEMIIASMGASHAFDMGDEEKTRVAMEDLHRLILEVQDRVLSLRMVSVKDMFHKLNRAVRDAAGKLDKEVEFTTSGEETALDRNVLDQVFSPLMHILRNSVDHGLESPEEREMANKSPVGQIHLAAGIESDLAVLSVTDDGRGIDRNVILDKAVRLGLTTKEQGADMSDEDVFAFLFVPGFSTKESVSELSGRGVGMDVVHESVRKLNGRVSIISAAHQGTRIDLRIPLTLAILEAMIVRVGSEACAIPISTIREVFRPEPESIREANGEDVVLHRGMCSQIIRLSDLFQMPKSDYVSGLMLVLEQGGESYALFIDDVLEQLSIVVKPIPPLLKGLPGVYGCTILGNGRVCLIIDVDGLIHKNQHDAGPA